MKGVSSDENLRPSQSSRYDDQIYVSDLELILDRPHKSALTNNEIPIQFLYSTLWDLVYAIGYEKVLDPLTLSSLPAHRLMNRRTFSA